MPKLTVLILLLLVFSSRLLGQAVTTIPAFPSTDQPVIIVVDVTQAKDSRAPGLLNKTSDVFLWSGVGTTAAANPFELVPSGQTNFSQPFTPGTMTAIGNNKWQITITPRTYFNIPAGKEAVKMGLLLKNGAGTAQTEDFIIAIYPAKLNAAFIEPAGQSFFVDANTAINIKATASAKSNLTLKLENQVVKAVANDDLLTHTITSGTETGARKMVVFEAATSTEVARDTFYFTIKPQSTVAALPGGTQDGITYLSNTKVRLSFFAPAKDFVYVVGEFTKWEARPEYLMKKTPAGDRYWLEVDNLVPGQEYAFQYLVNGSQAVADPYTEKILDPDNDKFLTPANYPNLKPYPAGATGIVSVLQTSQPAYNWKVTNFKRPAAKKLIIYELLVRDFLATRNYKTLTDTLSYLKRLGINAIELLPVSEFSGNDSWGYNPTFYFAPDKAYGTEDGLKAFIDKCHEMGIAVILDMVLNQADYEFPYVKMYWDGTKPSANNPYFNQVATHPFSVFFDFNHEKQTTQSFVQRVCQYWLQEYKFDGYRFDLSKGFTQKNSGNDVGGWGAYDASRVAIWKRIYNEIRAYDPTAYVILEHFADNSEEKELANYGMLFWGNLNHDYRSAAKGIPSNLQWGSYKARGWNSPHVVTYMESHDEQRLVHDMKLNGSGSGNYSTKDLNTALERAKLAAAFFIPIPGPKLIWQFGELGYEVDIDENGRTGAKPIRWQYQQEAGRQKLYGVYAELNKLKLTQPAFQTEDFNLDVNAFVKRITLSHPSMKVFILGNFDINSQETEAGFPNTGKWYDYFTGQEIDVTNVQAKMTLQPGEFHLYTTVKLPTPKGDLVPWPGIPTIVTGIKADHNNQDLSVSPNPTAADLHFSLQNNFRGQVEIQLQNLQGQVIKSYTIIKKTDMLQETIPVSGLAPGMYLLQVRQNNKMAIKKVIRN